MSRKRRLSMFESFQPEINSNTVESPSKSSTTIDLLNGSKKKKTNSKTADHIQEASNLVKSLLSTSNVLKKKRINQQSQNKNKQIKKEKKALKNNKSEGKLQQQLSLFKNNKENQNKTRTQKDQQPEKEKKKEFENVCNNKEKVKVKGQDNNKKHKVQQLKKIEKKILFYEKKKLKWKKKKLFLLKQLNQSEKNSKTLK
ncbi:hypothetical protein M0813_28579 [Anaeramoeba flamelloides]|uniref:Uncharacterized protein n=1 Tax=Anaeramoeba flamelloides TaxID=1746091 RepID=A0ABQ8XT10_9EUKA|nr:hypothetical protein M0813_28579 [Anaeramoeba flamelloides]